MFSIIAPFIIPAIAIIPLIILLSLGYVQAPPDKAFIISGLRKAPKILIGKAGLKLPFFERKDDILNLEHKVLYIYPYRPFHP